MPSEKVSDHKEEGVNCNANEVHQIRVCQTNMALSELDEVTILIKPPLIWSTQAGIELKSLLG